MKSPKQIASSKTVLLKTRLKNLPLFLWLFFWLIVSEMLIMLFFSLFPQLNTILEAFLDCILLIILMTPGIYIFYWRATKRKLFKINLLKTEKLMILETNSAILNSTNDIVFAVDTKYNLLSANNAFNNSSSITGRSINLKVGDNIFDDTNLDQKTKTKRKLLIDRALKGESILIEENILDETRNIYLWLEGMFNPIIIEDQIIGVAIYLKDISERKKIEIELQKNLQLLSTTQTVANLGTFILDIKSGTFESNHIYDTIAGIDSSFNKTMSNYRNQIVAPDSLDITKNAFQKSLSQKVDYNAKYKIIKYDTKDDRWVHTFGKFVYNENGEATQLVAAIQDMTDFENLVRQREIIFESISDYFYALDKNLKFVYCNNAVKNFYKIEEKDFIGKHIFDLLPELKNTAFEENLMRAIETNTPQQFEFHNTVSKNWFEQHFYPYENGCTVLFKSINDRVLSKQKLLKVNNDLKIKTQELTNTNIELERFSYVASHDLQEPLRMVRNFLQLFENRYKDIVDEQGKQYIHFAVDGANRMQALIKDLLQYSRVGSSTLEIEDVDMNAVMKDVTQLYKNDFENNNGEIIINNLPIIKAGKSAMMQLMQNLVGNAIKYRNKEYVMINVSVEETDAEWIFAVADNGIGIEKEYAEKIFIVFQRLHNKEEYSGTGIGLSICRKIVERYQGKIWVESELGKGSTFKFTIPKK